MLAMTVPGRGNQDTEQPSCILQEELASHIPLMPVACDAIQAPQLLGGGQGESQRRKVSATRPQSKVGGETF